jgi:hypothetical protein
VDEPLTNNSKTHRSVSTFLKTIISGGQTGVDRAALDVAIFLDIPHGGWCPRGRVAEDGAIPRIYRLRETETCDYAERTEKNVVDADGTLILFYKTITGGTGLTRKLASMYRRHYLEIDLALLDEYRQQLVQQVRDWICDNEIRALNVAGPRASSRPDVTELAEGFLLEALRD